MATSARAPFLDQRQDFVPEDWDGNPKEHRRFLAEAIQTLQRILITREITLTASSATTTLTDERINERSCITFMPTTANAATDLANLYVTGKGDGTATLNHTNNAQNDRTYCYTVIG